jgi:hypothetical protein
MMIQTRMMRWKRFAVVAIFAVGVAVVAARSADIGQLGPTAPLPRPAD